MKQLPEIRLTVENAEQEILKLLHVIKPDWNKDEIQLKKLSGGMSCLMYRCFKNENEDEGVTVRARTTTLVDFPHVRESNEAKVIQTMYAKGIFPEVLATFENGYCYTYVRGEPLYTYTNLSVSLDDAKLRLMARKLAEIHSVKVEGYDYTTTRYFRHLGMILEEKYPVGVEIEGAPTREELRTELRWLEEEAKQTGSPLVLCHGDPHPGNIVYDKEKGIVTYVDWELTHVGYQAGDIAYALQVLKFLGINPVVKIQVPEDINRKYCQYYLEKWYDIQGKNKHVTDEDISKLESQVDVFRLGAQLFWILLMVAQSSAEMPDHIDMDDMKDVMEEARQAQEAADAEPKTEDGTPTLKIDYDALANKDTSVMKDYIKQMIAVMYGTYRKMKDETFPGINE